MLLARPLSIPGKKGKNKFRPRLINAFKAFTRRRQNLFFPFSPRIRIFALAKIRIRGMDRGLASNIFLVSPPNKWVFDNAKIHLLGRDHFSNLDVIFPWRFWENKVPYCRKCTIFCVCGRLQFDVFFRAKTLSVNFQVWHSTANWSYFILCWNDFSSVKICSGAVKSQP